MNNKFLRLPLITVLALFTTLLFACLSYAKSEQGVETSSSVTVPDDSVLHLIPENTVGILYCPNPIKLDNKIGTLYATLSPQTRAPKILAQILAGTLGANFESLSDFEAIGLDLDRDFALFLTRLKPMQFSAVVHITDLAAIQEVIETETGGSDPVKYKGVTYWRANGDGNRFAILENTLVFSQQNAVCEDVIDTHNGTLQSITQNPNYGDFLTDMLAGRGELGVCFDIESLTASLDGSLAEEWKSVIENLPDDSTIASALASPLKDISEEQIKFVAELQWIGARLQMEGTDVQITPSLEFKADSKFVNAVQGVSDKLTHLGELPNRAAMNAAFQGSSKLQTEMSTRCLDFTPKHIRDEQRNGDRLLEKVKDFYESLSDTCSVSTSFAESTLPNYLFIYDLKDEQQAKTYMDEMFMEKLNYNGVYAGPSTMHNGVEIKSYIFPNLNENFGVEASDPFDQLPPEWHWYYAFADGQLLFATGTQPQLIQTALDRRTGNVEKFSEHPNYQKLLEKLGDDNNVFLTISPITLFKSMVPIITKGDPDNAAMIQIFSGMLLNLPENYSISFTAKARTRGIDAKLLLTLGDFKLLFQTLGMMIGM